MVDITVSYSNITHFITSMHFDIRGLTEKTLSATVKQIAEIYTKLPNLQFVLQSCKFIYKFMDFHVKNFFFFSQPKNNEQTKTSTKAKSLAKLFFTTHNILLPLEWKASGWILRFLHMFFDSFWNLPSDVICGQINFKYL